MRSHLRLLFAAGMLATSLADRETRVLVLPVVPPPVIVTRVREVPTPPPPAPADPLGCPELAPPPEPVGRPIDIHTTYNRDDDVRVLAASAAPVIAVRRLDATVRVSDDDGATFARAFEDHAVDELAIDGDGRLYARSGVSLGTCDPVTHRERWRETPFASGRVAALPGRVLWIEGTVVHASRDRGATWRPIRADLPWSDDAPGDLFVWRGALYLVQHYEDMCGVDDWPVYQLAGGTVTHAIFHAGYGDDQTLEAADDVGTTWTWRAHCPDCSTRQRTLLEAQKLRPVEGARVLAVYEHGLVELCTNGARLVYRAFPFEHIAAVDHAGRPLVVTGDMLARWEPTHGWRRLTTIPLPDR
jgi:hypothetical protein